MSHPATPAACKWQNCGFFASASFDNMAISEDSSTTICSHYEANYGRMSRQFPDNCQCSRERQYSLTLPSSTSFFISADGGCAVEPSSIAPFSELEPIILCPSSGEIQFHHQTDVLTRLLYWLIPSGLFHFFVYQSCVSIWVSFNTFHH